MATKIKNKSKVKKIHTKEETVEYFDGNEPEPIVNKDGSTFETIEKKYEAEIQKINLEKGYIAGVVLRANVTDLQGDWYSEEEVEKSAHYFMENSRTIRYMHDKESIDKRQSGEDSEIVKDENGKYYFITEIKDASIIEKSLDAPEKLYTKSFGIVVDSIYISKELKDLITDKKVDVGDWFMGVKLTDKKLIEKVRNGEIKSFSIGAIANFEETEDESEGKE